MRKLITLMSSIMLLLFASTAIAAIPGDVSEGKYIKAFVRGTQNVPAYRDSSLRTRGNSRGTYNTAAVYPTDEIRIYQMNGSVAYIGYIAGKSWVKAYIATGAITSNNSSKDAQKFSSGLGKGNVFARPNGTVYSGSAIDAGDTVWKLAEENGYTQVVYPAGSVYKMAWIRTGDYNSRTAVGHNPEGYYDGVTSNNPKQITVTGWAFDRDNLGAQLKIHVYVGGGTGSGAESCEITANKYRPDVNRAYAGVGEYHGFNETINVTHRTGQQDVYIYAINVGGGDSVELGHKTVNIKNLMMGDVNGDGKIDNTDLNLARAILLGDASYNPAADVNGDGKVTASDVSEIRNMISSNQTPASEKDGWIKTNGARLYFRSEASSSSRSLGMLNNGTQVVVLAHNNPNGWSKIRHNNTTGYVASSYVSFEKPPIDDGFSWPMPGNYKITTTYKYSKGGVHSSRYYYQGKPCGIDISVPIGTEVKAVANGVIVNKNDKGNTSFGKWLEIRHDDGTCSVYAHLSDYSMVSKGQRVNKGDIIARSGNTGNSTGPHLHFELSNHDTYQYYRSKGVI